MQTLLPPVAGGQPLLDVIHHCDALDLLKALPDACIDLGVMSPPYDDLRVYKGYSWNFQAIAHQLYRVLKRGGVLVWIVADQVVNEEETYTSFEQALYFKKAVGFKSHQTVFFHDPGTAYSHPTRYTRQVEYCFVFSKETRPKTINLLTKPNKWAGDKRLPGSTKRQKSQDGSTTEVRTRKETKQEGTMGNLWTIGTGYGKSTIDRIAFRHPAIFPEELARRHIQSWTDPGDIVLDCFMGTGTTAKEARALDRHYIGAEIAADYIAIARERLRLPFEQHYFEGDPVEELPLFKVVQP